MEHLTLLLSIFMINVVLSGDNAVVIALASRKLPPGQQKAAVLIGSAGAIVLRIILTIVIVLLLKIPLLQAIGALLLLYVAIKLLKEDDAGEESEAAENLVQAVKIIIFADLIMSLDNTLAIAAVSRGNWVMLIIGLATSIPIIIFCAQIILFLMKKFPVIVYAGAGILGWTAGQMFVEDKMVAGFLNNNYGHIVYILHVAVPVAITAFVLVYGWLYNASQLRKEALPDDHRDRPGQV